MLNVENKLLSYFFRHRLISSLTAVKNKRVYVLDSNIWWAYRPIGINRILDELFKYLLENVM
jgi:iron complex transport system substrate-binding protein